MSLCLFRACLLHCSFRFFRILLVPFFRLVLLTYCVRIIKKYYYNSFSIFSLLNFETLLDNFDVTTVIGTIIHVNTFQSIDLLYGSSP